MSIFENIDCMEGMKRYPDNYFDLAICDPPYGHLKNGNRGKYGTYSTKIQYGTSKAPQIIYHSSVLSQSRPSEEYFRELMRVSKNQIVWGGNYFTDFLPPREKWVVWDKRKPEGVKFADGELAWTSFTGALRIFRYRWNGMLQEHMGKGKEKKIHPTQKPVDLYKWLLENFAEEGYKILDTHVGSGSSLIACEKLGFEYVGFEIDPVYYELAKKRIESETQQMSWEIDNA